MNSTVSSASERDLCYLETSVRGIFSLQNAVHSTNFGSTGRLHYFSAVHKVKAHASYMDVRFQPSQIIANLKQLFNYLRINRTYEFPGTTDELAERMDFLTKNHKRFETTNRGNWNYKIAANFSFGTLYMLGGLGFPIHVNMEIIRDKTSNPIIHLTSKIRIEHSFVLALVTFSFIMTLITNEVPFYWFFLFLGLFLVVHLWFHIVYRVQENELIRKLKGQLKLVEKSESNKR